MKRARVLAFALALVCAAARASALEDGGTVGVFGTGAGARALAMGGAAAATADGAWGWTWNPGSLAWLSRATGEVMQSSPDDVGARETQAALAVPDWRWGAVALSWRQFGIDDIDGRDARGTSTGSFDDRETELGLAYGREVGPALGVGVAVKLRRQSLAGFSGGGMGADVGATFRPGALAAGDTGPWRDFSFGLRLANVLRPALRLDQDEVVEPGLWSGGVAWSRAASVARVTFAADVERVPGVATRARLGADVGLLGTLNLRAGFDGGRFTAGSALMWRGLDVAYAFRDHPLGSEQRVSLGWRLGRTVGEARELAATQHERELQERLQTAFDEDIARRAQAMLNEAQQALAAGALDEAWDKASVLSAMAPGRPDVSQLMGRIEAARAAQLEQSGDWDGARVEYEKALALAPNDASIAQGMARCRDEGDRRARRSAEHRRLVDAALRGMAQGDPIAARARLDSLRAAGVADSALAPLLLRLERLTASQVKSRLDQAQRLMQAGLLDDAAAALERARALAPNSAAVTRAREQLAKLRPAARTVAATPAPRPVVSESSRREAEQLYQSGVTALRAGHGDVAVRSWELAILKNPQHPRVREMLKREYQTRGLDAFSGGRLTAAVESWQRALQLDPSDARTRSYLDRAQEHLSRSAELGVTR